MITETCSVCATKFDVVFRYQMEERDGGFLFVCSQKCLEQSHKGGTDGSVPCDACHKRFIPELVSQVVRFGGHRKHACSPACREQLLAEAQGVRLGAIAAAPMPVTPPLPRPAPVNLAPPSAGPAPQTLVSATAASSPAPLSSRSGRAAAPARPSAPPSSQEAPSVPLRGAPPHGPASSRRDGTRTTARLKDATPSHRSGLHNAIQPPEDTEAPAEGDRPSGVVVSLSPLGSKADPAPRAVRPPRFVAVFNHKGGTGKTTTAVSIAAGLASKGKRVLLVDTDAQGNVAVSLGASSERSLYHVLVMGLRVADAARPVRPNLDLLPSNETLAAAELYLAGRQNRDRVLADRLVSAAQSYEYVILDCSPSLSLMNQNALVFADSVLVPVACDYLSLVGVRQVLKTVKNVNSLLHHPVQIWGVLPTFYDSRAKICNEAIATLKDHFGDRCLPPIRANIKVKEAPSLGQTIFEYAAGSHAADDYQAIAQRILADAAPARQPDAAPQAVAAG